MALTELVLFPCDQPLLERLDEQLIGKEHEQPGVVRGGIAALLQHFDLVDKGYNYAVEDLDGTRVIPPFIYTAPRKYQHKIPIEYVPELFTPMYAHIREGAALDVREFIHMGTHFILDVIDYLTEGLALTYRQQEEIISPFRETTIVTDL